MPLQVFQDKRLTLRQIKVLGVLLSFKSKKSEYVWPSREKISEICGLTTTRISTITTELSALGWLKKEGSGGRSRSTRYRICIPETVPELSTVKGNKTVPNLGTDNGNKTVPELGTVSQEMPPETVPELGTKTVPESGTGIELTSELTNKEHSSEIRTHAKPITQDWKPNEVNQRWLNDSGVDDFTQSRVIRDFVDYWLLTESKRKNWDKSFRRNPVVKAAVNKIKNKSGYANQWEGVQ